MSYSTGILVGFGATLLIALIVVVCKPMVTWSENGKAHWAVRSCRFTRRAYLNEPQAGPVQPATPLSVEEQRIAARTQWMRDHAGLLVTEADWHALEYDATHRTEASR